MIDSHVHFWNYNAVKDAWITDEMSVIRRDFTPDNLYVELKENGIEGCIAVQAAQDEEETHFLLGLARQHPYIKGVVGWIDLKGKHLDDRLNYFKQYDLIKGWRHIAQAEPAGFLTSSSFCKGIARLQAYNYTYDLLIFPSQLKDAIQLTEKFPEQSFVIDHCAKPAVKNAEIVAWHNDLKIIAQNPNVYCKLSGLLTEADWKNWNEKEIYNYLDVVFDCFGTKRLMFGSDWPVVLLAGNYREWKSLVGLYMHKHTEADRMAVFSENARQFYNL